MINQLSIKLFIGMTIFPWNHDDRQEGGLGKTILSLKPRLHARRPCCAICPRPPTDNL